MKAHSHGDDTKATSSRLLWYFAPELRPGDGGVASPREANQFIVFVSSPTGIREVHFGGP
jgi:hypothetical protein